MWGGGAGVQPCKGSLIPRHHPSGAAQQEGSETEMETGGRDTDGGDEDGGDEDGDGGGRG